MLACLHDSSCLLLGDLLPQNRWEAAARGGVGHASCLLAENRMRALCHSIHWRMVADGRDAPGLSSLHLFLPASFSVGRGVSALYLFRLAVLLLERLVPEEGMALHYYICWLRAYFAMLFSAAMTSYTSIFCWNDTTPHTMLPIPCKENIAADCRINETKTRSWRFCALLLTGLGPTVCAGILLACRFLGWACAPSAHAVPPFGGKRDYSARTLKQARRTLCYSEGMSLLSPLPHLADDFSSMHLPHTI